MYLLNLLKHQFEIFETGEIEHYELYESIEKEIAHFHNRLKDFPHFEHHHINLFYDFDDRQAMDINKKTFEAIQKIIELKPTEEDSDEEFQHKVQQIKSEAKKLKDNYSELYDIYKDHLQKVRSDISDIV